MNAANIITMARVLFIPIFVILLSADISLGEKELWGTVFPVGQLLAVLVFAVLSFTDWVDGYVARKFNQVTDFGKFLDPLADKLLMTAGLVMLVEMDMIAAWIVIVILTREFAVTGLRMVASSQGVVIAAANLGKIKTTLQIILILLLLLGLSGLAVDLVLWSTVLITVWSGIDYFLKSKSVLFAKEK